MYRQSIQFPLKDAGLREDVHALGQLIGETLREQGGDELFELVEGDRVAAIRRRGGEEEGGMEHLQARTEGRSPAAATDLTRAFSIWFQAVNTAEKVHRIRRRRQYLNDSSKLQPGGIADCIAQLKRDGLTLDAALALLGSVAIEPVFTAHPTESTRRTILRKQQLIAQDLLDRLNPALTGSELETLWARVRLQVTSIWQTEDHPREDLTVADEREHILFYLVEILYRVVPCFYEEIETALAHAYDVPLESLNIPSLLRFGSWVGGDMDGKADVHGKTIRETLHRHQQLIVSTYFDECKQLAETLSQSGNRVQVSEALTQRMDAYAALLPGAQELAPARHDRQPYRIFFGQLCERLRATYDGRPNAYQCAEELLADIQLAADSLLTDRGRHAGYFLVRRLVRRVRTFGFHLATLDVIQHTQVHDEVIAQGLGTARLAGAFRAGAAGAAARSAGARSRADGHVRCHWAPQPVGVRSHQSCATQVWRPGHRRIHRQRRPRARGCAVGPAIGALGRHHRQADGRMPGRRGAVARIHRSVGVGGRCAASIARRACVSAAPEDAGQPATNRDRLFGQQQGGRHCGFPLGLAGGADPAARCGPGGGDRPLDIPWPRRHAAARRRRSTENLVEAAPHGAIRGVLRLSEQGEVVNQSYGLRPIAMRTLERTFAGRGARNRARRSSAGLTRGSRRHAHRGVA